MGLSTKGARHSLFGMLPPGHCRIICWKCLIGARLSQTLLYTLQRHNTYVNVSLYCLTRHIMERILLGSSENIQVLYIYICLFFPLIL